MAKNDKHEVATQDAGLVTALPDFLQGTAGLGNENVSREDVTIPRIGLIQALSPERTKGHAKKIDGCEEGQFFNTVTREILDETFLFVDIMFTKTYGVFVDRNFGGGFKGQFKTEVEASNFIAQQENASQLELIDTGVHVIVRLDADRKPVETAILMFTKSKLKVSRDMNTILKGTGAARFATMWEMSAVGETNSKGQPYFNFKATKVGFVTQTLFEFCKKVYDEVKDKDLSASAAAANKMDGGADASSDVEY
jgi:hypothetical protein